MKIRPKYGGLAFFGSGKRHCGAAADSKNHHVSRAIGKPVRFRQWNKSRRHRSRRLVPIFPLETPMTCSQPYKDELTALRNLEAAVRACGLPTMMVSGQQQLDMLSAALKAVAEARATAR